jgi:uncharacterized protein YfcZ (UPF0381/DUF406 family)
MRKTHQDQAKAMDAFLSIRAEIEALLARLTAHAADHFSTDPEAIHWGHVGDLQHLRAQLREVADQAFHEGEYAA